MNAVIKSIVAESPASKTRIEPGDKLRRINGVAITDVLDYKFASYDKYLKLELLSTDGKFKLVNISKAAGEDIGLDFETYLMDKERSCANKCIFCFIDQNPKGMRSTIYYKDDDVRLSFLQGNYITLTNLSRRDVDRIKRIRISPINVSMHTLNSELRSFMLGNENAGACIDILKELADAGITLNCQIVCCPDVNDGVYLQDSIKKLTELGENINSVSIVPVGLTRHREGLVKLRPMEKDDARKIIRIVEYYGMRCIRERGRRTFFCADEIYMKAGVKLPPDEFYEEYPQLENGVGMMRLLITEFEQSMEELDELLAEESGEPDGRDCEFREELSWKSLVDRGSSFTIATGVSAKRHLTNLLKTATLKYGKINGSVFGIRNDFFGDSVTVSGLVTGGDLIAQLRGKTLGSRLLIPQNMLRHADDVFLDDVTVSDVSEALGIPVRVVKQDGADLLQAFLGS